MATPSATHPQLMDSMSIDGSGAVVTPAARNKLSAAAARAAMKNGTAATGNSAGDLSIRRLARQFLETNAEVGRSKVLAQDMGWLSKDANELEEKNMWTVQRAADFEVFKATTPMWKQLGSVVLMPLLAFTLGLSVHMAPMGHVSDGPAANWVHTFDVMWGSFISYQVPVALVRAFTRCPISVRKTLIATLPSSLLSGVLAYGLQIIWGYPLPFLPVIACFPGYMLSLAITYFLMPKAFKKFKATRRQLTAAIVIGQLTLGILAIWSIHRTIFVQIEDRPILQALMTLLLPIMKLVFRYAAALVLSRGTTQQLTTSPLPCLAPSPLSTTFAKIGQYVHIDLGPVMVFIVVRKQAELSCTWLPFAKPDTHHPTPPAFSSPQQEAFSAFFNAMLFNNSGVFASILLISFDVITNSYYVYMLCRGYMPQGVKGFAKSVRRRMSTLSSSRAVNPAPLHATTSGDVPHSRTSVASSHRSSVDANDADDAAAAGAAAPGPLIALAEGRSATGDSDSDDMDAITAANTAANSNGGASANKGTTNKAAVVAMPTTRQKNIDLVTRWASRKKEFLFLAEYVLGCVCVSLCSAALLILACAVFSSCALPTDTPRPSYPLHTSHSCCLRKFLSAMQPTAPLTLPPLPPTHTATTATTVTRSLALQTWTRAGSCPAPGWLASLSSPRSWAWLQSATLCTKSSAPTQSPTSRSHSRSTPWSCSTPRP